MEEVELVLDAKCYLGEGPCWVPEAGKLLWVDIHAGDVHTFDPYDSSDSKINILVLVDAASGVVRERIIDVEEGLEDNRFNDGKCDPAGHLIAGTMDDTEKAATGSLYSFSGGGGAGGGKVQAKKIQGPVSVSNGLAWSVDGSTMYYIDTPTRTVVAYKYNVRTGEVESGPEVCVRVGDDLGYPDGMTSDAEGMLWICMWGGQKITRWDPAAGALLASYPVPAYNVTCCAFGGKDLTDLYVTTARKNMSEKLLAQFPLSGGLFRLRPGVKGMPAVPCTLRG